MNEPVHVEIVAYAPTAFYHCTHCEVVWREVSFGNNLRKEQVSSALPPDLAQEYQAVSDWVRRLFKIHCDRVVVKVVDAASVEGVWKTIRYGLQSYPAIIIGNRAKFLGINFAAAEDEIARLLEAIPSIKE